MKKVTLLIVAAVFGVVSAEGVGSVFYEHYSGLIDGGGDGVVIGDDVEMLGGYVGLLTINGSLTVRAGEIACGVPVGTFIEDGTLNLHGGTVNDVGIRLSSGGRLNIYGYGFDSYYDDAANLHITGFLEDDHPFSVFVWEYQNNENPGEVNLIPEPAAMMLLGLGGLGVLGRRKCSVLSA